MKKKLLFFDYKPNEHDFFNSKDFSAFDISFFDFPLNDLTLDKVAPEDIEDAEIVSVFITSALSDSVIQRLKKIKLVCTRSTGYNNIDLETCKRLDIAVINVAKYGETTVAQYTFGLLIAIVRKIIPAVVDMKNGINNAQIYVGRDLNAITLGVLGTGSIGAAFCKIAHGADMKILAYDFYPNQELVEKYGVKYVDKETLLKNSDVISLHVPYNKENHHFISKTEIDMMKTGAYVLNTSRGELLDTNELYRALADKKLAGAALDVGECEALSFDMSGFIDKMSGTSPDCLARALVTQRLIELPNVILTPHIAYNTQEAVDTILETTFKNIDDFYNGLRTNRIV